jgi:LysR family hydrogen peroxide-inducible transcriptional activator
MNLQQFEYILALDQHKNFTKAAEACFITQATLSTMVKRLEEELGVVIFDRKTNQILGVMDKINAIF